MHTVVTLPLILKFLSIYLFMAVLGLHCCVQAFSSCSQRDVLSSCGVWAAHCGGFSCGRARTLGLVGFSRGPSGCGARVSLPRSM